MKLFVGLGHACLFRRLVSYLEDVGQQFVEVLGGIWAPLPPFGFLEDELESSAIQDLLDIVDVVLLKEHCASVWDLQFKEF